MPSVHEGRSVWMVPRETQSGIDGDDMEQALAAQHSLVAGLAGKEERSRRAQALEHMATYVAMLGDAAAVTTGPQPVLSRESSSAFSFKIEFDDGRWSVAEKDLTITPRVGDVISFAENGSWRVRATQLVSSRPAGKPAREFFVCVPTA
jgi:hypothetical protein